MSIEKTKNICYNEITKEVQSNENLNFPFFIFLINGGRYEEEKQQNQIRKSNSVKVFDHEILLKNLF